MEETILNYEKSLRIEEQRSKEKGEKHRNGQLQVENLEKEIKRTTDRKEDLKRDLEKITMDQEDQRKHRAKLFEDEDAIKRQLQALKHHGDMLQKQNDGLGQELQLMVETDELIRDRLNRRDRVQTLKHRNDYEVTRSITHLERSRSPRKY